MSKTADIKRFLLLNAKNIIGWKTKRKIVVFAVDDYGNVRIDSLKAKQALDNAGLKVYLRFDIFDSLENEEDLLALFDVLTSVKDKNDKSAVFTAFAVPANINFEKMRESNFTEFFYEPLSETFAKLSGYQNVYSLWKEGIRNRLIIPQFHGREHLNLKVLMHNLSMKDYDTRICFENRSYSRIANIYFPTINYTAAYDFDKFEENEQHKINIEDGLNVFEKVFGFRSVHFNAPGNTEHTILHETLAKGGIKYIDAKLIKNEYQGNGKYIKSFNYSGKRNNQKQTFLVRNCVFEPTEPMNFDWVNYAMKQIEIAFYWNRPAIISSHRVNFCGQVDPKNREAGLKALKNLLKKIVIKWPDVEFLTSNELAELISTTG